MKLHEYEAKTILASYGIPVPKGGVASTAEQARECATELQSPYMIKAQIQVAGRGKAGGILSANTLDEVEEATLRLLSTPIMGQPVRQVLIEEKLPVTRELYFGITVDRPTQRYVAIASESGGIDIETVALQRPEQVMKVHIDPLVGFRSYHARQIAGNLGYAQRQLTILAQIFHLLYSAGMEYDGELIEMNPLVETVEGRFVAVDARLILDDNALFRHPTYHQRDMSEAMLSALELDAMRHGLAYVKLEGEIGVIGNGAGLVMATLDTIQHYGGKPANFLDIGGGARPESMAMALRIVHSDPAVKGIFINILGGITRCDEVARGIVQAREDIGIKKPLVIRLVGTNEEEGKQILIQTGIRVLDSMEDGAQQIVEITR